MAGIRVRAHRIVDDAEKWRRPTVRAGASRTTNRFPAHTKQSLTKTNRQERPPAKSWSDSVVPSMPVPRRKGWDSNPRGACAPTRFPAVRTRPLCDPSVRDTRSSFRKESTQRLGCRTRGRVVRAISSERLSGCRDKRMSSGSILPPRDDPRCPRAAHECWTRSIGAASRSDQRRLTEDGGGGGIRTHEALVTPTAFRERHLKPLGHPSTCQMQGRSPAYLRYARRDSNPRPLGPQPNALSTELRARDTLSDAGVRSTGIAQYSMRDHLMARGRRGRTVVCAQDNRRGGKSKAGYRCARAGRCGGRVRKEP